MARLYCNIPIGHNHNPDGVVLVPGWADDGDVDMKSLYEQLKDADEYIRNTEPEVCVETKMQYFGEDTPRVIKCWRWTSDAVGEVSK